MKYILIVILNSIFITCPGQQYKTENQLFDCVVSSAEKHGLDFRKKFDAFEDYLIKKKVLKDNSGNSYYQIYKQIEAEGDVNFSDTDEFSDSVDSYFDTTELKNIQNECSSCIEKIISSKEYKKSKLYILDLAMDSLKNAGILNVSAVAGTITNVLSPADFDQNYYKLTTMLMLLVTSNINSQPDKQSTISNDDKQVTAVKGRNILYVRVTTENDSVFVNDKKIPIKDLEIFTKNYIENCLQDTIKSESVGQDSLVQSDDIDIPLLAIVLEYYRETRYATYVTAQNQLTIALGLFRDDIAEKNYQKKFDDLNNSEKQALKELNAVKISEVELQK